MTTQQLSVQTRFRTTTALPDNLQQPPADHWTPIQNFSFRLAFVFFALLIFPTTQEWYIQLFNARNLFEFLRDLTDYSPRFINIPTISGKWGWQSYANWGVALSIAIAAAALWTLIDKSRTRHYKHLYYWLRVAVRYRIALGVLDYGFMKFYPVQMPYPGLGVLNSQFGDLSGYKLYWQAVGIVPWYEIFLGCVEVSSAILLFFRPTASIGAVIIAGVLYNVAHANHAYDGGVHVFSAMFSLLALFLLAQDIPALWRLFIKREPAQQTEYVPVYKKPWLQRSIRVSKYIVVITFTLIYGYLRYDLHYNKLHLKKPVTPGLHNAAGFYQVTSFERNGSTVPLNPSDTTIWQDLILEKHSTLIIRINKLINIPQGNGSRQDKDVDRSYELAGVAGGRHFYYYDADTVNRTLTLQDKGQVALLNGEGRISKTKKSKASNVVKLLWHYERPTDDRLIITGKNEQGEDLKVTLDKQQRSYLLESGL